MAVLVTMQQAIDHLKQQGVIIEDSPLSPGYADFELKLNIAEALVLDYVKQRLGDDAEDWAATVDSWDVNATGSPDLAPLPQVQGGVLVMLGHLFRYRGDDEPNDQPKQTDGSLPADVRMLLGRHRDPTLA